MPGSPYMSPPAKWSGLLCVCIKKAFHTRRPIRTSYLQKLRDGMIDERPSLLTGIRTDNLELGNQLRQQPGPRSRRRCHEGKASLRQQDTVSRQRRNVSINKAPESQNKRTSILVWIERNFANVQFCSCIENRLKIPTSEVYDYSRHGNYVGCS